MVLIIISDGLKDDGQFMKYAKIFDGDIYYAPNKIRIGSATIYNPTVEQLTMQGFKPVEESVQPTIEDGYHLEVAYSETESSIVQEWIVIANPETAPTVEEQIEANALAIEDLAILISELME